MIDMRNGRSQDPLIRPEWILRFPILAALKGFGNGINPRWWPRTVVVSRTTGEIIRLEARGGGKAPVE
jgi:hypothetical protein